MPHAGRGVDDRPPAGAPAQVREQRGLHRVGVGAAIAQRGEAHDYPRRAEAALAGAARGERVRPWADGLVTQPLERGDRSPGHAANRRDAGHPWRAVDQHGAATALALRAAPILRGDDREPLAQHGQQ